MINKRIITLHIYFDVHLVLLLNHYWSTSMMELLSSQPISKIGFSFPQTCLARSPFRNRCFTVSCVGNLYQLHIDASGMLVAMIVESSRTRWFPKFHPKNKHFLGTHCCQIRLQNGGVNHWLAWACNRNWKWSFLSLWRAKYTYLLLVITELTKLVPLCVLFDLARNP